MEKTREEIEAANRTFHSKMAGQFDETQPYFVQQNRLRVRAILEDLAHRAPSRALLDLGCGTGFVIGLAVQAFERILGVDITPEMIARVPKHERVEVRLASAESVPAPDGSFGVVTAYGLLQHLHDYLPVFREAHRCLAPGGFFYADESQNHYCAEGLSGLVGRRDLSPVLSDEVALVTNDQSRYEQKFGLDADTVATAMYQGKAKGGVREEDLKEALSRAGFRHIDVRYRWFLGRSALQRTLAEPLCDRFEVQLQTLLPLSRALFKYVSFVAQK